MASRFPFTSFPHGWYVVGFSTDVAPGEVRTVHYLGQDIVLFRGHSGVLTALDKTCPHLGAHLGGGSVQGECLRCPFHHWAFDHDGRCVDVPYAPKIPPRARATRWHHVEHNGVIMVYHGPACDSPPWTPPPLPEDGWTPNRTVRWELRSHPQEVAENTVDCAHLGPVHHTHSCTVRSVEREGHTMRVVLDMVASGAAIGMPEEINDVELDVTLHGLGHVISNTYVSTAGIRTRQRIHPTPIDGERIAIFGISNIMAMPDPEYTREMDEIFYAAFLADFPKDFPIWENKSYVEKPLLAGGDGPIGGYRRWCRQFYDAPQAAAAPEPEPVRAAPSTTLGTMLVEPRQLLARAVGRLQRLAATVLPGATTTAPAPAASDDDPHLDGGGADGRTPTPRTSPAAARFASVDAYFGTLAQRFDPAAAAGLRAVFQWSLTGDRKLEVFAEVEDGRVRTAPGAHGSPTVTIEMSQDDYLRMINGELNGALAFSTGRGRLRGPVRLAMRMQKLFPLGRAV